MVKKPAKPNAKGKAKAASAAAAAAAATPSKAPLLNPGSAKAAKFKKKVRADLEKKAAAAAGAVADAAGAEASASAPVLKPANAPAATANGVVDEKNGGGGSRKKSRKERAVVKAKGKGMEKEGKWKGKEEEKREGEREGFIFMCSVKTKAECYQNRVFGLPKGKIEVVEKIQPGAKLFLYDFDLKLLYGVYKAKSKGGLDLVRDAFGGRFPAQVKFSIDKDCLPLPESSFKHAIKENYDSKGKFTQELNPIQVCRLLALFKPVSLPQAAPQRHVEERRPPRHYEERRPPHHYEERRPPHHYEERRRPYHYEERRRLDHYEERRPSPHVEEMRQPHYVEERRPPAFVHAPLPEDPYRTTHIIHAPLSGESQHGHSLATIQDDHIYYQQVPLAPEPQPMPLVADSRHIPIAQEPHHVPLALEPQPVPPMMEPQHVPPTYHRYLASSDALYYRRQVDPVHDIVAPRSVADVTVRDPLLARDYRALPGEVAGRADRAEELYRSDQLVTHVADLPRYPAYATAAYENHPTYAMAAYENPNSAYAENLQPPSSTRVNNRGVPVSSLYSFAGAPVYR